MTTFKIQKSAMMKNPRHDTSIRILYHDEIVILVIQKMRKLGNRLIYYSEDEFSGSSKPSPTIMQFEKRENERE